MTPPPEYQAATSTGEGESLEVLKNDQGAMGEGTKLSCWMVKLKRNLSFVKSFGKASKKEKDI